MFVAVCAEACVGGDWRLSLLRQAHGWRVFCSGIYAAYFKRFTNLTRTRHNSAFQGGGAVIVIISTGVDP